MKKVFVIILLATIGFFLIKTFMDIPFGENRIGEISSNETAAGYYLNNTPAKTKVANVVTAIVVNYRGLDTLGEVTVLFLASTGLASILYRRKREEEDAERLSLPSSRIMRTGVRVLFPVIVLLGIYVFIHGHLTPGGGFQGGTIVATGFEEEEAKAEEPKQEEVVDFVRPTLSRQKVVGEDFGSIDYDMPTFMRRQLD